jgi:hypothetical protein
MAERALDLIRDAYQQSRSPVADLYVEVAAAHPRLKKIVFELIEKRDELEAKLMILEDQRRLEVQQMTDGQKALDKVEETAARLYKNGPPHRKSGSFPKPPDPYQDFHPHLIRLGLVSRLWDGPNATAWRHFDLGLAILRVASVIEESRYGESATAAIWYARAEWVFRGLLDQRKEVRRNGRDEFSALRPRERELARQKLTTTAAESSVPVPGQTADPVDDLLLGKIIQLCIEREYAISARDFKNHVKHASAIPALAWIPTVGEFATHRGGEPLAKLSLWEKDPGLALLNQSGKAKAALALLLKWETTSNIVPFRFKK